MRDWPRILSEARTLDRCVAGASLARLGDGEFKLALGRAITSHAAHPALTRELRTMLRDPHPDCVVAIPPMDPASPRRAFWEPHKKRFARIVDLGATYGSALVGQSLGAPWVDTDEHVDAFRSLWRGKSVVAVSTGSREAARLRVWRGDELVSVHAGGDGSLERMLLWDAAEVLPLLCPQTEAYAVIDEIETRCVEARPDIVVACAGPMATALAHRLAARRIQCIDLGRGLGLILRHEYAAR